MAEWIIKALVVTALVAVLLAAVAGVVAAIVPVTAAGSNGIAYLADGSHYRDADGSTFGPVQVVQTISRCLFPGTVSPTGVPVAPSSSGNTKPDGGWLIAVLLAIPSALIAWLVIKYLVRFFLGG